MAPETLDQRVDSLERRVTSLEELPGRIDGLGTQISQLRDEARAEFSAIRGEMRSEFGAVRAELDAIRGGPRTPDMPSLMSLQADIRSVRDLVRETSEQTMAQMRVLYEDLVDRIKLLGERGGPRNPPA